MDKSDYYDIVRPENKLFDFQIAATNFCLAKIRECRFAMLALDTGCGKTLVVREIIKNYGNDKSVVVISPGGLCRQTRDALRAAPWEDDTLDVLIAETGKQLNKIIDNNLYVGKVTVVNRALGSNIHNITGESDLIVIDEAHESRSYRMCCPGSKHWLFVTATPVRMMKSLSRYYDHDNVCFRFCKTDRVIEKLGTAIPVLEVHKLPAPSDYGQNIFETIMFDEYELSNVSKLVCLLEITKYYPIHNQTYLHMFHVLLGEVIQEASRFVYRKTEHEHWIVASLVLAERKIASRVNSLIFGPLNECLSLSLKYETIGENEYPCGLRPHEYTALYRAHCDSVDIPPLCTENFTTALVRLPDNSSKLDIPDSVRVFKLTSDMSAAARALTIKKFKGCDGNRAKLTFFIRGITSSTKQLYKSVACMGCGFFARTLQDFLLQKRLLVTDKTIDAGYDIHKHVGQLLIPRVVEDYSTMLQLVGRICRIATDIKCQGTIKVLTNIYENTLDELFTEHSLCRRETTPITSTHSLRAFIARLNRDSQEYNELTALKELLKEEPLHSS
jgi:hypothetical protein